jgi:translation initiation factor IF-2
MLVVFPNEQEAKQVVNKRQQILREQGLRTKKHITLDEIGRRLALGTFKELNVIVKGDVDGSVEALCDALLKLSTNEIQVNIIHRAVGQITESDVNLASASDAIIVGFQVRPSQNARRIAENENIEIRLYSVIYSAIEEIKTAMEGMLEPSIEETITGYAEVREVFKITKVGTVAGCVVTEGKVYKVSKIRIIREGIVIHSGTIEALRRFKDDAKEVYSGQDCGIKVKNFSEILEKDLIEAYEEKEVKRKL